MSMRLSLRFTLLLLAAAVAWAAPAPGTRALRQANGGASAGAPAVGPAAEATPAVNAERQRQVEDALAEAEDPASTLINRYQSGNETERTQAFADVWLQGNGPAIVIALTTLENVVDVTEGDSREMLLESAASGMREVERQGLGTMVSEGVATGLVFVRETDDARPMVDLLKFRLNDERDQCAFVKIIMQDAELMAIRLGFDFEFSRSFNGEEHKELKECFFEPCEDFGEEVAKCCTNKKSINSGVCGCMGNKREDCDFNLVFKEPRPVWVCRQEVCQAEQAVKCLCAEEDTEEKKGEGNKAEEDG